MWARSRKLTYPGWVEDRRASAEPAGQPRTVPAIVPSWDYLDYQHDPYGSGNGAAAVGTNPNRRQVHHRPIAVERPYSLQLKELLVTVPARQEGLHPSVAVSDASSRLQGDITGELARRLPVAIRSGVSAAALGLYTAALCALGADPRRWRDTAPDQFVDLTSLGRQATRFALTELVEAGLLTRAEVPVLRDGRTIYRVRYALTAATSMAAGDAR